MLTKRSFLLFLLFSLMFGFQAMAQDVPSGKWWRNPSTAKALELTGDQVNRLEKAYVNSRRELIKQKSQLETEQFRLQEMFDKKNYDEDAVKTQYQNVEKQRKELSTEQFKYIMEVRKIIGYDKYNQLTHGQVKGKGKSKNR